jgi:hypothetical protein
MLYGKLQDTVANNVKSVRITNIYTYLMQISGFLLERTSSLMSATYRIQLTLQIVQPSVSYWYVNNGVLHRSAPFHCGDLCNGRRSYAKFG